MGILTSVLAGLGSLLGKVLPNRAEQAAAQAAITKAEVEGAPASRLRLWRGFICWVLGIVLAFDLIVRPVIMTYWPDVLLPPAMTKDIMQFLLTFAGLG